MWKRLRALVKALTELRQFEGWGTWGKNMPAILGICRVGNQSHLGSGGTQRFAYFGRERRRMGVSLRLMGAHKSEKACRDRVLRVSRDPAHLRGPTAARVSRTKSPPPAQRLCGLFREEYLAAADGRWSPESEVRCTIWGFVSGRGFSGCGKTRKSWHSCGSMGLQAHVSGPGICRA